MVPLVGLHLQSRFNRRSECKEKEQQEKELLGTWLRMDYS